MFQSVKAQRISDEIVDQIKEALFDGKIRAGDRLPTERELAEQFSSSRTTVREALRTLEQEGVLQIKKGINGGIFVVEIDHKPVTKSIHTLLRLNRITIDDIAESRLMLEPGLARLAAQRATRQDLVEIERVIDAMHSTIEDDETPAEYDLMFHKLIARAAHNPLLEMLAGSMLEVATKTITEIHPGLDTLRHVLQRHREVFEAISARDGDLAQKAMHGHIVDIQARLSRQVRNKETSKDVEEN